MMSRSLIGGNTGRVSDVLMYLLMVLVSVVDVV